MATGEAFSPEQLERLDRALEQAEKHSGIPFTLRVGAVRGDIRLAAERTLSTLVGDPARDPAVLIVVSPGQRVVRISTTPAARKRISNTASSLASLAMTSSFSLGDLVGGLTSGIRQLAEAAGPAATTPAALRPSAPTAAPAGSPAPH
ncbi:DUF5130 domain-containing protein [Frankia sp. AgPm24]|uniref:DUF5130 domain-containing protein n=1 Tax=Frankia umida TaxID=573489 RepID=A0ABT0JXP9_9ACTN|nr:MULTISPECIES: DUF5130 family protein [Frankia]MCK9876323.1 DUF5130 domain-containing protein [Frankia umida]MCK9920451.1 DUF5130 domain-containing protein [Frankia sp. AgPm24]